MHSSTADPEQTRRAMELLASSGLIIGIIALVAFVFSIVIYWRIATKAGYPGAMSLLMLVPLVNVIVIVLFAFTEWPVERLAKAGGGYGGPAPGTPWQPGPMNPPVL